MAGNNSIQILRGNVAACSATSLIGQPIWDNSTNYLYIGDGSTAVNTLTPIKSSYANQANSLDTGSISISGNKMNSGSDPYGSFEIGVANATLNFSPYRLNAIFNGIANSRIELSSSSLNIITLNESTSGGTANSFANLSASSMAGAVLNLSCNLPKSTTNSFLRIANYDSRSEIYANGPLRLEANNIDLNVSGSNQIKLNSNGLSSIYLNGINANMFAEGSIELNSVSGGINITALSSGQLNLHGDSGVTISAYGEVNINRSGGVISFPNAVGTVALTSQAWVPTYWPAAYNRTWIEINASTSCAAYNGFYYEEPGSEKRFAIDGRLFGKDQAFFSANWRNLATAFDNMAYGFVVAKISMNAVAYNGGNIGQVHTISTGSIPIFFHPAQLAETQYYGAAQTFNPNSTACNASKSYSDVVEFVPYIDARMQGDALLLVPKISYLHGPSRVLDVLPESIINCTLSYGYIMARADK